jgi:asparagine synthase (glutamine-hydrolysing)
MCGLVGIITKNRACDENTLNRMVEKLSHRGPDDSGTQIIDFGNIRVGLGHARLSILDLSQNGHQPKESISKRYVIIYNGEIYNFKEIQRELTQKGYEFNSLSDTEVVLSAFEEWGVECVHKFVGMFAFAILDKKTEKLLIFRDRAGVKPLYYYIKDGLFCFGSELKSLMQHPNFRKEISMESLSLFLKYSYIPSPYSIFQDTHKLEPGHYLTVDLKTLTTTKTSYWNVLDYYNRPKMNVSESEALKNIETLMQSACDYRMVSDVPVGVFLSGGYDSSAVAALLQKQSTSKIKTFTIGFEDAQYDEAPFARDIAKILGTDHTQYYCSDKDALDIIPLLPKIYDEPFADTSAIPTILVSKIAREHVKVSLSADGGDEVFGGYTKYTRQVNLLKNSYYFRNILKAPVRAIKPLIRNTRYKNKFELVNDCVFAKDISMVARKRIESDYINVEMQRRLLNEDIPTHIKTAFDEVSLIDKNYNNIVDMMMGIDYKTYMVDDVLHKVDRATMSVGLEGREPLLDHRLIEYVAQLPSNYKIKGGVKKHLLKSIVHKYIPIKAMDRPKKGFGVPFDKWFSVRKNEIFEHHLSDGIIKKHGLFDANEIAKLKSDYAHNSNALTQTRLWAIFVMNQWLEEWL